MTLDFMKSIYFFVTNFDLTKIFLYYKMNRFTFMVLSIVYAIENIQNDKQTQG